MAVRDRVDPVTSLQSIKQGEMIVLSPLCCDSCFPSISDFALWSTLTLSFPRPVNAPALTWQKQEGGAEWAWLKATPTGREPPPCCSTQRHTPRWNTHTSVRPACCSPGHLDTWTGKNHVQLWTGTGPGTACCICSVRVCEVKSLRRFWSLVVGCVSVRCVCCYRVAFLYVLFVSLA